MVRAVGAEQLLFIQKTRYSRAAGVQASAGRVMERAVSVEEEEEEEELVGEGLWLRMGEVAPSATVSWEAAAREKAKSMRRGRLGMVCGVGVVLRGRMREMVRPVRRALRCSRGRRSGVGVVMLTVWGVGVWDVPVSPGSASSGG